MNLAFMQICLGRKHQGGGHANQKEKLVASLTNFRTGFQHESYTNQNHLSGH
jgi:hypothetical protein